MKSQNFELFVFLKDSIFHYQNLSSIPLFHLGSKLIAYIQSKGLIFFLPDDDYHSL